MKTHFFLIFLLFCLIQKAAGQPKSPATFQDLQRQIAVLPDTVRFERLVDFYQNKVNETQFTESGHCHW
jgi:hypothetical protein